MAGPDALLDYVQERTDLDVIAVTDHDDIDGALAAREAWARRGRWRFEVVTGIEVTTIEGHLLALFVDRPIPSLKSLSRTIESIHAAGGLAVIPHPLSWLTRSIGRHGIERVLAVENDSIWFDGIELANMSPAGRVTQARARRLNERWRMAATGGSDAHFLQAVGSAVTRFDGHTAADLRAALERRETSAENLRHPAWRELGIGNIVRQQYRGLLATPRKVVWKPIRRAVTRQPRSTT